MWDMRVVIPPIISENVAPPLDLSIPLVHKYMSLPMFYTWVRGWQTQTQYKWVLQPMDDQKHKFDRPMVLTLCFSDANVSDLKKIYPSTSTIQK